MYAKLNKTKKFNQPGTSKVYNNEVTEVKFELAVGKFQQTTIELNKICIMAF